MRKTILTSMAALLVLVLTACTPVDLLDNMDIVQFSNELISGLPELLLNELLAAPPV